MEIKERESIKSIIELSSAEYTAIRRKTHYIGNKELGIIVEAYFMARNKFLRICTFAVHCKPFGVR